MSDPWQILIYEQQKRVHTIDLAGVAELGRQSSAEEPLYSNRQVPGRRRVVIAHKDERSVSRQHVLLEPLGDGGGFKLTNLSAERLISLPDGRDLKPQESCTVPSDTLLTVGKRALRPRRSLSMSQEPQFKGLSQATIPPGQSAQLGRYPELALPSTGMEMKALVPWLQAAMDVLQSAAGSADFFDKAAGAVVNLIHLDSGRVLLLEDENWQTRALCTRALDGQQATRPVSSHVLRRVSQEKRTFWEVTDSSFSAAVSLRGVDAVVAAPILDRNGTVIGALYGDRTHESSTRRTEPISELEAMLVEVLARGVAAGLARLEQERAVLAARVQFEQFFTPELSRQLALDRNLLSGRDAEVTLLFCDIRGFSRISERLGPARTVEWISDVMQELSLCVHAQGGVLVDYIGDELIAMWGAPAEQPDHARRACRAALAMLDLLPRLNARWQEFLQESMLFGIGINTGTARVGNTGSQLKFKYGPLGNNVNLASRVQGATKYLKCSLLITGATQAQLDDSFLSRRLCQVRVVNIEEAVNLHELVPEGHPGWPNSKIQYERALEAFEEGNFAKAARILGNWRDDLLADAPAVLLLHRTVQCLVEDPNPFDPVLVLTGK